MLSRPLGRSLCHEGNCLDLDELLGVTEDRDAKQCAWRVVVAETARHCIPRHK
jgi:hypothetical protein